MKKIVGIISVVLIAIMLSVVLVACSGGYSVTGRYYEYNGEEKDENSWIELQSGKKWIDDSNEKGTFELDGDNITLSQDGIELLSGTLSKGVLTIKLFGITSVYKKDGVTNSGSGGTDGGGTGDGGTDGGGTGDGGTINPELEEAKITAIEGGTVNKLNVNLEVAPTVENIDLSGMITVSKGATWQLYKDITGQTSIPTKYAANIANGENKLYIVVNSADRQINRTYILNIWKNYEVNITWISNGQIYETTKETTHTKLGAGTTLYREGYTFLGWGSTGHFVEKPVEFVAEWRINSYTVTFNSNGGSTIASKTIEYNSLASVPKAPTKIDFIFGGWYKEANFTTPFDFSTDKITDNTTIYAKWVTVYELLTFTFTDSSNSAYSVSKKADTLLPDVLVLPAEYKGKPVIAVDNRAFGGCSSLTSVTFEEGSKLTNIGNYAFSDCRSLTSVTIPESVTSIASWAFDRCTALTNFAIPAGVTSMGDRVFSDCSSLTCVEIPAKVIRIGKETFLCCRRLTRVTIPSSVMVIADRAFGGCSSLKSITIPASVVGMGREVFSGCNSLAIYAEAESQPAGWNSSWNDKCDTVYWGRKN